MIFSVLENWSLDYTGEQSCISDPSSFSSLSENQVLDLQKHLFYISLVCRQITTWLNVNSEIEKRNYYIKFTHLNSFFSRYTLAFKWRSSFEGKYFHYLLLLKKYFHNILTGSSRKITSLRQTWEGAWGHLLFTSSF